MRIEKTEFINISSDGTFSGKGGFVPTKGRVAMSKEDSDEHWVSIIRPRTKQGVVESMVVYFDNKTEMNDFLKNRELNGVS